MDLAERRCHRLAEELGRALDHLYAAPLWRLPQCYRRVRRLAAELERAEALWRKTRRPS